MLTYFQNRSASHALIDARFKMYPFALFALFSLLFFIRANGQSVSPPTDACSILNSTDVSIFLAKDAYDCLRSVPFNSAVAARFLKYIDDRLQFQTTTEYLKSPPATYQQPGVDLWAGLARIQQQVNNNEFENEYDFEVALQQLLNAGHDSHLTLDAGALSVFTFLSPIGVTALSEDGIQPPKIYSTNDLQAINSSALPSPVIAINGKDPIEWLKNFAAKQAVGNIEPHADWNQLMSSPVSEALQTYSLFESDVTFYPGDTLEMTKANGSVEGPYPWLAYYNPHGPTGPLATGGDFYNFFVLGLFPEGIPYPPDDDSSSRRQRLLKRDGPGKPSSTGPGDADQAEGWLAPDYIDAYPIPNVVQPELGFGGYVTGYFLDTERAVLSIPSFESDPQDAESFTDTVTNFLQRSKAAGMKQVIIDLQGNRGGTTLLAVDTFKQFFPSVQPDTNTRMRAQTLANTLGEIYTDYFNTHPPNNEVNKDYYMLVSSEWVTSDRLNDDGQNFTSWEEFYGPRHIHGDTFTNTQHLNLSSYVFDVLYSGGIDVYGYSSREATSPNPPFASEDILILTDGLCASDCAMFLDLMVQQGVRTVAAGGLPEDGPMQAAAGTRGGESCDLSEIDDDIDSAARFGESAAKNLPDTDQPIWVITGSVNLRDRLRPGDDEPLQFKYMPATCRIFYTLENYAYYPNLWNDAGDAIWKNPKLCVSGSTGHQYYSSGSSTTAASLRVRRSYLPTRGSQKDTEQGSAPPAPFVGDPGMQPVIKRDDIGKACPHLEGRQIRPNEQCVADVPQCGKDGKLDFKPQSRIVQMSSFRVGSSDPPDPSKLRPQSAYGCTNDNGKCLPIKNSKPYKVATNGHSSMAAFSGGWKITCYCKLPSQVCGTSALQNIGLHVVDDLFGVGDGSDDVPRIAFLESESKSTGNGTESGFENWE